MASDLYPNADVHSPLVQQYLEDGYVAVHNVLDPEFAQKVARHVDWLMQQNPDVPPELLEHQLMRDDPFWIEIVKNEKLLEVVKQFLGQNIACYASHYVCKMPYQGKRVHWHQDGSYWPLKPMQVLSVWLAVDESTTENSCVQFAKGTHKDGLQTFGMDSEAFAAHVKSVHEGEVTSFDASTHTVVDMELKPGSISVHHPYIFHGSHPNTSPKRRCGLTIRYISTSTLVVHGEGEVPETATTKGSVFLCCGEKDPNVPNFYRPVPVFCEGRHFK